MSGPIIETEGLTKKYGNFTAVDSLDLRLEEGEVFGFLGPNGSGKSTTILMILGLTEPTEGWARVSGFDPTRNPLAVKRNIGYLPESIGFYNDLSGRENLQYTARLNSMPREDSDRRIDDLLDQVELSAAPSQPVGQYSRGMRQRLGLADVLLKQPQLVILDDPTLGLDPAGVNWLLQLIKEMSDEQGITVFISSHRLHEVQRICNRVGIMSHGKMVLEGPVDELMNRQEEGYQLDLEVDKVTPQLLEALRGLPTVERCEALGNMITVSSKEQVRIQALSVVQAQNVDLLQLQTRNRSLEEIYLRYFQEV
jgi:ABC-2 type transport system ATP-binding protein